MSFNPRKDAADAEEKAAKEKEEADAKAATKAAGWQTAHRNAADALAGTSAEKLRDQLEGTAAPVAQDPTVRSTQVTYQAAPIDARYPDGARRFDSEGRELDAHGRRLDVPSVDAQGRILAPPPSDASVAATAADAPAPDAKPTAPVK